MSEKPPALLALVRDAWRPRLEEATGNGAGLRVEFAANPESVAARLREASPVVLWDESMGLERFCRLVADQPTAPYVLVMDAWLEERVQRALSAGAQDVLLIEELAPERLRRRVETAIRRHALVAERNDVLERLRKLEQYKTEFINTAAHELNSPLTPVKLQLHLLRTTHAEGLGAAHKHSLDIIGRNIDRLIHLVSDTMDAARLQASRLTVRKQAVDLQRLAREVVQSHRASADAKKVRLEFQPGPPQVVQADPDRISQVLTNLVGNAVKFTPQGGRVQVHVTKEGDAAVARVQDTGIGLRTEDFPRLFQPFSQTHEWLEGPRSGSGLGLYISQGIIEQHGGRIWCDSPGPNRGATFAFALPFPTGEAPIQQPTKEGPAGLRRIRRFWPILYFTCPTCGSRDINMRILRNRYECRACTDEWQ